MAIVTVDGVDYSLPETEFTSSKVAPYNSLLVALQADWSSWTPIWTNLNPGASGVVTAKYRQIGKSVDCHIEVVFAGAGLAVSGAVSFSLPVTRAAYGGTLGLTSMGLARFFDTSGGTANEGTVVNITTTTGRIYVWVASGTHLSSAELSSTIPFTWATGDEIHLTFRYEAD